MAEINAVRQLVDWSGKFPQPVEGADPEFI